MRLFLKAPKKDYFLPTYFFSYEISNVYDSPDSVWCCQSGANQQELLKEVGYSLNVSIWILQRRLKVEGTSFQAILEKIHQQICFSLLENTGLTVNEIAFNWAMPILMLFERHLSVGQEKIRWKSGKTDQEFPDPSDQRPFRKKYDTLCY